ncbi:MAG: hypothetical protein JNL08_06670 [Planctomycetes bacterium]|nr:hypothetical protein [Planctomycetota bacterium]
MIRFACLLALLLAALPAQRLATDGPHVSPFRAMRAVADGIEVQVDDDTWFALDAIAGVDTATLLRGAERLCGDRAWQRLTEDLPALLAALGTEVGDRVDLVLRDRNDGARIERRAVPMTAEKRTRLREANRRQRRAAPDRPAADAELALADAQADLAVLRELLDTRFAYRTLRPVDLAGLLRAAEAEFAAGAPLRSRFVQAVDRVLRAFGDGHSRVDGAATEATRFLPFLVQQVDGGAVAFRGDRSAWLDSDHPFVTALDGVPIARWLEAARARGTAGSAAMQHREAERGLREIDLLRADLGLSLGDHVAVTLRGPGGEVVHEVPLAARRPAYGAWPRTETRRLDGGIGYLRLPEMSGDAAFLDGLDAAMRSFRDTNGLVLDVRGNGGGTRDALRRLAPYLLPAAGAPVVGNVAAVLLTPGDAERTDALADRGLFPRDWPGWTKAQRAAIDAFARGFRPSWSPPRGRFSAWHYLVLDRADNAASFAYGKPVVVLIDRACFSATDVFAAALGALPNVRLVGETTSGGSGRARPYELPRSGVRLQLSTMASFRPDGVLFEGNGVVPDVEVATQPGDLIGSSDAVLERALELLR